MQREGEQDCPRCNWSTVKVHRVRGITHRTCRGCHFSFRKTARRVIEVLMRTDDLIRFRDRVRREA